MSEANRQANIRRRKPFDYWVMPVTETGCHLWLGALNTSQGEQAYGTTRINGRSVYAHRFAWIRKHGPVPEHMLVLHKCDVATCVNPDHLYLGTPHQNNMDMMNRKRNNPRRGTACTFSKLTETNVLEIRALLKEGKTEKGIADLYNVSRGTISNLKRGKTWKHVRTPA